MLPHPVMSTEDDSELVARMISDLPALLDNFFKCVEMVHINPNGSEYSSRLDSAYCYVQLQMLLLSRVPSTVFRVYNESTGRWEVDDKLPMLLQRLITVFGQDVVDTSLGALLWQKPCLQMARECADRISKARVRFSWLMHFRRQLVSCNSLGMASLVCIYMSIVIFSCVVSLVLAVVQPKHAFGVPCASAVAMLLLIVSGLVLRFYLMSAFALNTLYTDIFQACLTCGGSLEKFIFDARARNSDKQVVLSHGDNSVYSRAKCTTRLTSEDMSAVKVCMCTSDSDAARHALYSELSECSKGESISPVLTSRVTRRGFSDACCSQRAVSVMRGQNTRHGFYCVPYKEGIGYVSSSFIDAQLVMIAYNENFQIMRWNSAAEALTGFLELTCMGKPLREFVETNNGTDVHEALRETRRNTVIKVRIRALATAPVTVLTIVAPILDDEDNCLDSMLVCAMPTDNLREHRFYMQDYLRSEMLQSLSLLLSRKQRMDVVERNMITALRSFAREYTANRIDELAREMVSEWEWTSAEQLLSSAFSRDGGAQHKAVVDPVFPPSICVNPLVSSLIHRVVSVIGRPCRVALSVLSQQTNMFSLSIVISLLLSSTDDHDNCSSANKKGNHSQNSVEADNIDMSSNINNISSNCNTNDSHSISTDNNSINSCSGDCSGNPSHSTQGIICVTTNNSEMYRVSDTYTKMHTKCDVVAHILTVDPSSALSIHPDSSTGMITNNITSHVKSADNSDNSSDNNSEGNTNNNSSINTYNNNNNNNNENNTNNNIPDWSKHALNKAAKSCLHKVGGFMYLYPHSVALRLPCQVATGIDDDDLAESGTPLLNCTVHVLTALTNMADKHNLSLILLRTRFVSLASVQERSDLEQRLSARPCEVDVIICDYQWLSAAREVLLMSNHGALVIPLVSAAIEPLKNNVLCDFAHVIQLPIVARKVHALMVEVGQQVGMRKHAAAAQKEREDIFTLRQDSPWTRGRLLGRGTHGAVYEATTILTGGKMAVKMFYFSANHEHVIEQLLNEIKIMCSLDHENIVHYFHCERSENNVNLFMELCDCSLADVIAARRRRPATSLTVTQILHHVLIAVAYLHSRGIVHRDIKPQNILLKNNVVKLTDFGTARKGNKVREVQGTFRYMAPEVYRGEPHSSSCDIWSIGCLICELYNCPTPFMDHASLLGEMTSAVPHLSEVPPNFVLRDILYKCFQLDPSHRPTANELLTHALLDSSSFVNSTGITGLVSILETPSCNRNRVARPSAFSISSE